MNVSRLEVTYRSEEINEELDKKILEFFNTLNFTYVDKIYHSIIWRRSIFFESPKEIADDIKIENTMNNL